MSGDMTIFTASQFNQLGGITALSRFDDREQVFEALRQSTLVRQSLLAAAIPVASRTCVHPDQF